MAFLKSVATISSLTIISRVFGFIRDALIAAFVGAGPIADAFFVAFKVPNFFRRLFAEGALNAAFVPLFSRTHVSEGASSARLVAEQVFSVLMCTLLL
ncbi:MAG: lipid II flippase MurJ, partial [Caedimonadaceae bacterium]